MNFDSGFFDDVIDGRNELEVTSGFQLEAKFQIFDAADNSLSVAGKEASGHFDRDSAAKRFRA